MSLTALMRELEAARLRHHGVVPDSQDDRITLRWGKWKCPTCGEWVKEEMARRCKDCNALQSKG